MWTLSSLEPWKWQTPALYPASTSETLRYQDKDILRDWQDSLFLSDFSFISPVSFSSHWFPFSHSACVFVCMEEGSILVKAVGFFLLKSFSQYSIWRLGQSLDPVWPVEFSISFLTHHFRENNHISLIEVC